MKHYNFKKKYPLFAKPFAPKKSYHARLSTIQSPCIGRYWPDVSVSRLNSIVQKGCAVWRAVCIRAFRRVI